MRRVPRMLPKPQVTAADMPMTKGASPTTMRTTEEGFIS